MNGTPGEWDSAALADVARWLTIAGCVLVLAVVLVILFGGGDDDDRRDESAVPPGPPAPDSAPIVPRVEAETAAALARNAPAPAPAT